jgi:hypothetical protein
MFTSLENAQQRIEADKRMKANAIRLSVWPQAIRCVVVCQVFSSAAVNRSPSTPPHGQA